LHQAIHVSADPGQIRTALEGLLRNAIEAAPAGGWARLSLQTPTMDCLEFVVEDNGPGIGHEQREHLFDPFYSGRLSGRGRGLGLPTAWQLARQHGGNIRYDHHAVGMTRFVLSLPCQVLNPEPGQAAHHERHEPTNGVARTISLEH
jgi:signal transduction histidine kinase